VHSGVGGASASAFRTIANDERNCDRYSAQNEPCSVILSSLRLLLPPAGIGFLGAGALIKTSSGGVFGFTTAALIWAMAAFGITIASEEYALAGLFYAIIWLVLIIDRVLEFFSVGSHARTLVVSIKWTEGWWERLGEMLPRGVMRKKIDVARGKTDADPTVVTIWLGTRLKPRTLQRLIGTLLQNEDIRSVSCE
jgi:uncharacterized membrane protein YhiD involved in acid resistance